MYDKYQNKTDGLLNVRISPKQIQDLFCTALSHSFEHNVAILTTRSSITKKNIEYMRYHTNPNTNTSLIFAPSSSPVYEQLSILKKIQLNALTYLRRKDHHSKAHV